MLDCIKFELESQKKRFEQMRDTEIANAKARADNDLISPKFGELENVKQAQLVKANEEYNAKVVTISNTYDAQKETYRKQIYDRCETEVATGFKAAIDDIEKQLAE